MLLVLATGASPVLAPRAHAQDLALDKLTGLLALPVDLTPARAAEAGLPEWVFRPASPVTEEEPLTWGWWPPSDTPGHLPGALLSLRPNHGAFDVVLHLRRAGTFNQLHRDLQRQKLLPLPVTCLGCQGERFTSPTYTVAFYQGKPEPYPYIVVLHRTEGSAPTGRQPAPGAPLFLAQPGRLRAQH